MPSPIVVIGSVNMDLVSRTPRIPKAGETILGKGKWMMIPGGKGANQAVAAARLGGKVRMIARIGEDDFGARLMNGLIENGVDCTHVQRTPGTSSGCATILVDDVGENSIVVAPGANAKLTPKDIDDAEDVIATASVVVLQLEIPLKTVRRAINIAWRHEVFTILDPAPAIRDLPRGLFAVDLLTPNQSEAELLTGEARAGTKRKHARDTKAVAAELLARGARSVVLKLGAEGSLVVTRKGEIISAPAFKARVVDTTAAGDAFTGALAVARAEGMSLAQSVRFANAAGAICCTTFGAQPSLPTRDAVNRLLARGR
jgi:ribokinase